jgi:cytochrome c biogenesis protein CcmG, thiol:disulfide interchange protein DsbE
VRRRYFCSILLGLSVLLGGCNRGDHPESIDRSAPDFSITEGGRTVALHDYRGKLVILNFWATWCAPCIEELPSLNELQRRLPQAVVVAVSVDADAQAYREFLTRHPVDFLTVREGNQNISGLYGTHLFPETYIIDPHGIIRRKFINSQDWTTPEIVEYLSKLEPSTHS